MKTLVVANQKGGVGKTSTFVHVAFDFLERGLKVVVIDLDTGRANASYTLRSYRSGLVTSELFAGVPSGSWPQTAIDLTDSDSPSMALIASDIGLANLEMSLSEAEMVTTIAHVLASRVPVWKIKKTAACKATQEIRALAAHVFENIEMTQ